MTATNKRGVLLNEDRMGTERNMREASRIGKNDRVATAWQPELFITGRVALETQPSDI
jgi:hypothetical protein